MDHVKTHKQIPTVPTVRNIPSDNNNNNNRGALLQRKGSAGGQERLLSRERSSRDTHNKNNSSSLPSVQQSASPGGKNGSPSSGYYPKRQHSGNSIAYCMAPTHIKARHGNADESTTTTPKAAMSGASHKNNNINGGNDRREWEIAMYPPFQMPRHQCIIGDICGEQPPEAEAEAATATTKTNVMLQFRRNPAFLKAKGGGGGGGGSSVAKTGNVSALVTEPSCKVEKNKTIFLRTTVQSQPRPSPPFTCLVKVIKGPYAGAKGYLSPTGTYGYSVITTLDGQLGTVQDDHVVDAAAHARRLAFSKPLPPPGENRASKRARGGALDVGVGVGDKEEAALRDIFLDSLRQFIHNDAIDRQRAQLEELHAAAREYGENDDLKEVHNDLVRGQQQELDAMYDRTPEMRLALSVFDKRTSR